MKTKWQRKREKSIWGQKIGSLINKENGAVLAKDEKGDLHIVTKYDVIQSLAK